MLVGALGTLLITQLPVNAPGKAVSNVSIVCVPATYMGNLDRVPSFWLEPGPNLAVVVM